MWPSAEPATRAATTKNSDAKNKGRPATRETEDAVGPGKELTLDYQYDKDSLWKYSWGR